VILDGPFIHQFSNYFFLFVVKDKLFVEHLIMYHHKLLQDNFMMKKQMFGV